MRSMPRCCAAAASRDVGRRDTSTRPHPREREAIRCTCRRRRSPWRASEVLSRLLRSSSKGCTASDRPVPAASQYNEFFRGMCLRSSTRLWGRAGKKLRVGLAGSSAWATFCPAPPAEAVVTGPVRSAAERRDGRERPATDVVVRNRANVAVDRRRITAAVRASARPSQLSRGYLGLSCRSLSFMSLRMKTISPGLMRPSCSRASDSIVAGSSVQPAASPPAASRFPAEAGRATRATPGTWRRAFIDSVRPFRRSAHRRPARA